MADRLTKGPACGLNVNWDVQRHAMGRPARGLFAPGQGPGPRLEVRRGPAQRLQLPARTTAGVRDLTQNGAGLAPQLRPVRGERRRGRAPRLATARPPGVSGGAPGGRALRPRRRRRTPRARSPCCPRTGSGGASAVEHRPDQRGDDAEPQLLDRPAADEQRRADAARRVHRRVGGSGCPRGGSA